MKNGDFRLVRKSRFRGMIAVAAVSAAFAFLGSAGMASAEDFQVKLRDIVDTKAVFGTVQAAVEVPARARISGTLEELSVEDGSFVKKGDKLALIVDQKLILQRRALDAKIAAAESSVANIQLDYDRAKQLLQRGTIAQSRIDQLETQLTVAQNNLKAAEAEKAVLEQQLTEGDVLAPATGRVLNVPVTAGSVMMGGEVIAKIAIEGFLLRLELPERHARVIKVGDMVTLGEGPVLGADAATTGKIVKVYPEISQGRVVADAAVPGLGDFFVGERIQARIVVGERQGILIPQDYVSTRFGLDFVKLAQDGDKSLEVVVELGEPHMVDGKPYVEILSGLKDGDKLVRP